MATIALTAGVAAAGMGRAGAAGLATPTLSLSASTATTVGFQVLANVNLNGGASPTGSIIFKLFAPTDPNCGSSIFTSVVAVNGGSMNSAAYMTSMAGTYRFQATYTGDANNNPVGPTACANSAAAVMVSPVFPVATLSAAAPVAGAIHASVVVNGYHPTGNIFLTLAPPGDSWCAASPAFTATVAVNGAGAYVSPNYTPTVSGTYKWRVSYSGDTNNYPSAVSSCNDSSAAVTVTVGGQPQVTLTPSSLAFAPQTVGTTSASQTVTLSNPGATTLNLSSVTVVGPNAPDYGVNWNGCAGATVPPGAACSLVVSFTPSATGARTATLNVGDNAAGSPQTAGLSGTGTSGQASFTYPLDGQRGVDTTRAFSWSTAAGSQGYYLMVGSTAGGYDLVNSGVLPPAQSSYAVPTLPSGQTLYGLIFTEVDGNWSRYQQITFTAVPGMANFSYPLNGQANVDTNVAFSWSTSIGSQGYYLMVGTTAGGYDLVNSGILPPDRSSYGVGALPSGRTLYGALFTEVNGSWSRYQQITFTAAPGLAQFVNPIEGQAFVDTRDPFTWSTIPDAQAYYLLVGTSQGGYDLVNSGAIAPSQAWYAVPALPAGVTLYATLFTETNGSWSRYQQITFTARAR